MRVNHDRVTDLVATVLVKLASPETQAAFWFYRPITLPVIVTQIGGASPFAGSGSNLAGYGALVQLNPEKARALADHFAQDVEALAALLHLEVESAGELQFRAYDNFAVILPGPAFDSSWLTGLIE